MSVKDSTSISKSSNSPKSQFPTESPLSEESEERIASLARSFTSLSNNSNNSEYHNNKNQSDAQFVDPFNCNPIPDPRLDPFSDSFSAKAWTQNLVQIINSDPEYYKPKKLSVAFKNLHVYGSGTDADFQRTIFNLPIQLFNFLKCALTGFKSSSKVNILHSLDGLIHHGELVIVLGRPGAGCSTFLKTIAAQTYGFHIDSSSIINYEGLTPHQIQRHFRGDVVYSAETDEHFPHLTVGQTLLFSTLMRTPHNRLPNVTRTQFATHCRDVYMAMYGLSHTIDTKVGNQFVRGVSGGERKRVSIAEVTSCGAPLQLWDNSTRGLDSSTALNFVQNLRVSTDILDTSAAVAIYQASQDAYNLFHKVLLLYEGRQIYFGPANEAKQFFLDIGYECAQRQTTADFLTSLTNPIERIVKPGFESRVPRTPDEFEAVWKSSEQYKKLSGEIDQYLAENPLNIKETKRNFKSAHAASQAKRVAESSPYTINFWMQVKLCTWRAYLRLRGDPGFFISGAIGNFVVALIVGSLFYNLRPDTGSFYYRGALIFFALLFNALSCILEIMSLYSGRPIVDKHRKLALYRPAAEQIASIIMESPSKFITAISFNITLYFLTNLRRAPGHFFVFFLFTLLMTYCMSHVFRTIGSFTNSMAEAMVPASIFIFAMNSYTGFVIPTRKMHLWARWINYIDPMGYAYESLLVNEFSSREFACASYVPEGPSYNIIEGSTNFVCSAVGATMGQISVLGDTFLETAYRYRKSHLWRNFGIVVGFIFFFLGLYLAAVEVNPGTRSKGEVLVFQRSALRKIRKAQKQNAASLKEKNTETNSASDLEKLPINEKPLQNEETENSLIKEISTRGIDTGDDIFHWKDVCYTIKIKSNERQLLDHCDGWVKPGTLTALMGASGAGKTTLLDVLASRVTMGVVTGKMFVNGHIRDDSFQRSTGYVQQADLHLSTSTVREALVFSALLRQPRHVPDSEKIAYAEKVLSILEMDSYADAVVGELGEGLNVEQRKRLTIGVELAAKPKLLLFLDEPTSGLDSQTSWSICLLIRKLADSGQAILCTIHQPSAILIQQFDRLLLLAAGGKTVYFGDLGKNCSTLINYFERNGAPHCPPDANPAEWMLSCIGAAPGSKAAVDFPTIWKQSPEREQIRAELDEMEETLVKKPIAKDPTSHLEFAVPLWFQFVVVTKRVFQMYSRTPIYIIAKFGLSIFSALFNGFTFFKEDKSLQGMQNQMYSVFLFTINYFVLISQMLPQFVKQRALYEARERPAKTYSWKVFILSQIFAEIPLQFLVGTVAFFCWYYPVGFYVNAEYTNTVHERGALTYLYSVLLFIMSSAMGQMCIAGVQSPEAAANLGRFMFSLSLMFCGVLAGPKFMPGFWIFMYRVSPFTYFISGNLSSNLANAPVECASYEYRRFIPPTGMNCRDYMSAFLSKEPGYLLDENSTTECAYCPFSNTTQYLDTVNSKYSQRWWHMVILIAYILFNYMMAIFLYWFVRVPKKSNKVKEISS